MQHLAPISVSRAQGELGYEVSPPGSPSYLGVPNASSRAGVSGSGASNSNAPRSLALKISRLLSASLEDAGTRSALETLDEFDLVDEGIKARVGAGGLAADSRNTKSRRLRAEIDRRLLDDSMRFLDAFKQVNDVSGMLRCAESMIAY
jgi:hypothetical protein